ncbi:hypothetical protein MIND_00208000 [Mycena indigotica]|uniref:Uncharacterized protein n=1 Tax=Mycena indigotica TaxID=2126181 RepID=A0A8H6T6H9_9AGAR|nr:uncharacterized protein MIND_00208000 [Mycena indigotica]KAF7311963.1 hypothetical protein MIND_00208000 [Mycena indigotica]
MIAGRCLRLPSRSASLFLPVSPLSFDVMQPKTFLFAILASLSASVTAHPIFARDTVPAAPLSDHPDEGAGFHVDLGSLGFSSLFGSKNPRQVLSDHPEDGAGFHVDLGSLGFSSLFGSKPSSPAPRQVLSDHPDEGAGFHVDLGSLGFSSLFGPPKKE